MTSIKNISYCWQFSSYLISIHFYLPYFSIAYGVEDTWIVSS